jgi:isoquinoline 1-oxidoreductase subunit alpha
MEIQVNGVRHRLDPAEVPPEMPLLWVLRDELGLTGTKYGCGVAVCGACTVHVDGQAVRSCVVPVSAMVGKAVRTVEALAPDPARGRLHALQRAWLEHQVPQCGYCQSGVLMAVAALLIRKPRPTDADIDTAIDNLCRCGSTPRMRLAIHAAARAQRA